MLQVCTGLSIATGVFKHQGCSVHNVTAVRVRYAFDKSTERVNTRNSEPVHQVRREVGMYIFIGEYNAAARQPHTAVT